MDECLMEWLHLSRHDGKKGSKKRQGTWEFSLSCVRRSTWEFGDELTSRLLSSLKRFLEDFSEFGSIPTTGSPLIREFLGDQDESFR